MGVVVKGNFKKTEKFLKFIKDGDLFESLSEFGRRGVAALNSATPTDTGITAGSWDYQITQNKGGVSIYWVNNSFTKTGVPIVILLQYGHGTGTGGYVRGRDFINPAIQPIFKQIADGVWKAVESA